MSNRQIDDIYVGMKFQSNFCGEFEVVENLGPLWNAGHTRKRTMFRVRSTYNGYETTVIPKSIRNGEIYNPYYPKILGVACMGIINEPVENYKREREIWSNMIIKIYNKEAKSYQMYGAKGVTMDPDWLCFENFYRDIQTLPGYKEWKENPGKYNFDKDFLQAGVPLNKRIYSKKTCMFITVKQNRYLANRKSENEYVGVRLKDGRYEANFALDGRTHYIGGFKTAEEAAAAINLYTITYFPDAEKNNVPFMSYEEMREADLSKHTMCKINNGPRKFPMVIHENLPQFTQLKEMCRIVDKTPQQPAPQPTSQQPAIAAKEYLTPTQLLAPAMKRFYNQPVEMCHYV